MTPSRTGTPAAVVFDLDGLLLDTESAWTRADVALYGRYKRTFTLEQKHQLVGTSKARAQALLEEHLGLAGRGAALQRELHRLVLDEIRRTAAPLPGAAKLVAGLNAHGVPLGIASNSPRELVEVALKVAGLSCSFDVVVCADDVVHPKPAPDIYVESCTRLGAVPALAVALEDSPTGVAAAQAAGLYVIGVPSVEGVVLPDAQVEASSLDALEVWSAVGLVAPTA
jgi:HAD superfamily hydrolase (TIGR01509 family)